jgi:hypothetical protein
VSVEVALAVLKADSTVTGIVGSGSNAKISPLIKSQGITPPAVTLQRISLTPQNHLRGNGGLDQVRIQLDAWCTTYDRARSLANACRNALETAGHVMESEIDNYDPETDPGLYRITQDFLIWV